ncbi:amidohydrolase family protein [Granulicella cerasi]|uniref:Amidohydrolase family protein n=1 Tax=Granulicella cerasi TaxID=741063 RepID=A0ABW1Z976_9BACT|nr:amidohydrolase family protein [Granulicella cerasi]
MHRRRFLTAAAGTALAATTRFAAAEAPAPTSSKLRTVALEEHFMAPGFVDYFADTYQNISPALAQRGLKALSDFGDGRLEVMDANGLDYAVLSLSGPGVQIEKDTATAVRKAREVNDLLAHEMQKRPTRYGGLAHLAMQDPKAAADELERSITQLKMQGAMINGQTNGAYLDLDKFSVFWERAAALEAPIYLHPGNPIDHPAVYAGHDELWGPVCSWNFETAAHALRMVFAGVFERYPKARLILGHMGETLPIELWRFDSRWPISHRGNKTLPHPPSYYIKRNIALTTSGVCDSIALRCAIDSMGLDNVMFSVDYPFEKTDVAMNFLRTAKVTEAERQAIAHGNATRLLRNMPTA